MENETGSARRTAPMKTWLRVVLFASLALNLMVVGLVGGAIVSKDRHGGPPSHVRAFGPMTEALSSGDRRSIGREMRDHYRAIRAEGPSPKRDFSIIITALRAVPFDANRVSEGLKQQKATANDRLQHGQELLVAQLTAMSDEERAVYATKLEEILERHSKRGRRSKRDR